MARPKVLGYWLQIADNGGNIFTYGKRVGEGEVAFDDAKEVVLEAGHHYSEAGATLSNPVMPLDKYINCFLLTIFQYGGVKTQEIEIESALKKHLNTC